MWLLFLVVGVVPFLFRLVRVEEFFVCRPDWLVFLPMLKRYIDDVFGFWNGSRGFFELFVADLNLWSLENGWGVEFVVSAFGSPTPFLDVEVFWSKGWQTVQCLSLAIGKCSTPSSRRSQDSRLSWEWKLP